MTDSPRSRFRLPHWGWFLLATIVLGVGFVASVSYPGMEDGWPTIDAAVGLSTATFCIWLPIRLTDGGKKPSVRLCACIVLVIGVGVVSIWLPYQWEQDAIHNVERRGGSVVRNKGDAYWGVEHTWPSRVWKFKVFEPVVYVNLAGTKVTDAEMAQLSGLTSLRQLNLSQTAVLDTGLAHLRGLKDLFELYLGTTPVTDAGLAHLSGLTKLQWLSLYGTQVTDAGLTVTGQPSAPVGGGQ